jgi:hypothetical protein
MRGALSVVALSASIQVSFAQDCVPTLPCVAGPPQCVNLCRPDFTVPYNPSECAAVSQIPYILDQQGQPVPDPNYVLPEGSTWVNCDFVPDRRPIAWLQLFEPGAFKYKAVRNNPNDPNERLGNPRGLKAWWHIEGQNDLPTYQPPDPVPKQFRELVELAEHLYQQGFRRFMLQLPAGAPFGRWNSDQNIFGGRNFSMNQWNAMPAWKQQEFADANSAWLTWINEKYQNPNPIHHPVIELYMAAPIGDGICTQLTSKNDPNHEFGFDGVQQVSVPVRLDAFGEPVFEITWVTGFQSRTAAGDFDPRKVDHIRYVLDQITPWMNIGVKRFWLDAGSNNQNGADGRRRWGSIELAYHPALRAAGCRFGTENLPVAGSDPNPDFCTLSKMPAYAHIVPQGWEDPSVLPPNRTLWPNWQFPRQTTEVHLGPIQGNEALLELRRVRERGAIVDLFRCDDTEICERVKRVYSMGPIWIADFDGNRKVDIDDLNLFTAFSSQPFTLAAFAWGDIDGNGVRDANDAQWFNSAYAAEFGKDMDNPNLPPPDPFWIWSFGLPDDL